MDTGTQVAIIAVGALAFAVRQLSIRRRGKVNEFSLEMQEHIDARIAHKLNNYTMMLKPVVEKAADGHRIGAVDDLLRIQVK